MSAKIVTIATFDQAALAHLAKDALEAAGIRAVIADENLVAMDWLLSVAVGGIKVQVLDTDAERAVEVLESHFGPNNTEAIEEEREPEASEEPAEQDHPPAVEDALAAPEPAVPLSQREIDANRAFRAAFFGLAVPLLLFYSFYLCLITFTAEGTLTESGRRRLIVSFFLTLCGLFVWWSLVGYYPDLFF